jgi:hypothetical protein
VSLVATKCPTCGSVGVYFAGSKIATVSLAASVKRHGVVIPVKAFTSVRAGTIKIVITSATGKIVRIDGLGVAKY